MNIKENKKIYFLSDSHLGIPDEQSSFKRELKFIKWLDKIKKDACEIYLLGDIFDFWFEYKTVIPKGYIRLLGKLAEISDAGIKINYLTGNHDMWVKNYFEKELKMTIIREPIKKIYNNLSLYIGHGDGLGSADTGYKIIKKIFSNKLCQKLYSLIHPDIAIPLGLFFSNKSRNSHNEEDNGERLILYSKQLAEKEKIDYFIFGHRHLPLNIEIMPGIRYINIGDWLKHFSYGVFDGKQITLEYFTE